MDIPPPAQNTQDHPDDIPQPEQDVPRKPAIRTMRTDVETLYKTTKPSLIQIINKGVNIPLPRRGIKTPSLGKRILAWLILGISIFLLGGGSYYFYTSYRQRNNTEFRKSLVPPPPFFATETARTVSVEQNDRSVFLRLMLDSARELERGGTFKRIILKIRENTHERFGTLDDIFQFYQIAPPAGFLSQINPTLTAFFYYNQEGGHFGIVVKTRDRERTLRDLLNWEPSLMHDFTPLFFNENLQTVLAPFEDRTYRNIDWRFLKFSHIKDLGIGYAVFPATDYLIITTSRETMETVINRLLTTK